MNYEEWMEHEFSSGCYAGEDYKKFQRQMRADLKKQAVAAGMHICWFSGNHYCFTAGLQSDVSGKFAYVSVPDVRYWKNEWFTHVLYRTMAHEKDYTGGGITTAPGTRLEQNAHFC